MVEKDEQSHLRHNQSSYGQDTTSFLQKKSQIGLKWTKNESKQASFGAKKTMKVLAE